MNEIVVISGKGGTGKTSMTASFAVLEGENAIIADCDVDAADMHLLVKPDFSGAEDFYSGEVAIVNPDKCINCGKCIEICRFDAISDHTGRAHIDPFECEGCGYCARICPEDAIQNVPQHVGQFFISNIKTGSIMAHAKLGIGADNSGKLVAKVKNEAKRIAEKYDKNLIIVDGAPGIGCPVVSSLSGANYVILVTEASVSGLHDLKRVYELIKTFKIPAGCIINKVDINQAVAEEILDYLAEEKIFHLGSIPYDETFSEAMVNGKTIIEYEDAVVNNIIKKCWELAKQLAIKK